MGGGGEFGGAVADLGLAVDSVADVVAGVAAQVDEQIADRVYCSFQTE